MKFLPAETKLTRDQQWKVREHANTISNRLNAFEDTADLIVEDTIIGSTETLDFWTTPECHCRRDSACQHTLPKWFIDDAKIGRDVAAIRHYASVA